MSYLVVPKIFWLISKQALLFIHPDNSAFSSTEDFLLLTQAPSKHPHPTALRILIFKGRSQWLRQSKQRKPIGVDLPLQKAVQTSTKATTSSKGAGIKRGFGTRFGSVGDGSIVGFAEFGTGRSRSVKYKQV